MSQLKANATFAPVKVIRHILLYLAGALVLAHNLVPHQHHQEGQEAHCAASSQHQNHDVWDLLGDLFHHNPGNDHLEDLRKTECNSLQSLAPVAILSEVHLSFKPLLQFQKPLYQRPQNLALPDYLVISLRSLRSPPLAA